MPDYRLREPQLTVAWEPRRRTFAGSLRAVVSRPKLPKNFLTGPYFRNSWVRGSLPKRALAASMLWHIVLVMLPFPVWKQSLPKAQLTLPRIEITWYGPVRDFSPLDLPGPPSKPSPPGEPDKPLPRRGADAYHPRQTIISAPRVPTHPRQILIRPDAPPTPPKILPPMPNIVQWADLPKPSKPRLQISKAVLAKLRPKRPAMRPPSEVPLPEVPNLEEQVGDLNIAADAMTVPKPQLPVAPTSVPRVGPRQTGQEAAPAPDIGPNAAGDSGLQRLIAISASPAPSMESLPLPGGNLAARLSISPEGTQPGVPNGTLGGAGGMGGDPGSSGGTAGAGGTQPGSGAGGNGSGPPGVSISGGSPNAASTLSGLGLPGARSASPGSARSRPEMRAPPADASRKSPGPDFDRIKSGAPPEGIFGPKHIYTLHVNMPNLASVTGSWVLSFTELRQDDEEQPKRGAAASDLTGPVPLRKVDPKYPPSLVSAKVEGEVVLYAVIRRDGSVDSIQLVRGIEPQLDTNAMEALARWRFRPAERRGAPVELEAVIHIPFRAVAPSY